MGLSSFARAGLLALAAATALAAVPAGAQQATPGNGQPVPGQSTSGAQPPGGKTFGAWSQVCETPPGAQAEQCLLMQNVIDQERPEVGLSVAVLKTADRKVRLMRILAPLGVWLHDGVDLYIDDKKAGRAYFTRCFQEGCTLEFEVPDDLLKSLRAGDVAIFALKESPDNDERIGIPVDLAGFSEGYDSLP
ncbi:invasion associated locus B family protein [Rhizobiaceae bacterium BDR2-2]|uniref:Invasion associated locus B family protein n=1 Tax=Ectorhizobium quercum TaxID=2965071 RepID=A0AAE3N0M8_9HYPH|nr:invasion associated locus B family protein [Ectorhizobium quercum]MCX8996383.1 invasion associated locus B family protein [Ectorhizobium quercum]MCX8998578.1 invasion associated locus B family protein [Ectorhizobium quercum]